MVLDTWRWFLSFCTTQELMGRNTEIPLISGLSSYSLLPSFSCFFLGQLLGKMIKEETNMGNKIYAYRMFTVDQVLYMCYFIQSSQKSCKVWVDEEAFLYLPSLEGTEILRCQVIGPRLSRQVKSQYLSLSIYLHIRFLVLQVQVSLCLSLSLSFTHTHTHTHTHTDTHTHTHACTPCPFCSSRLLLYWVKTSDKLILFNWQT